VGVLVPATFTLVYDSQSKAGAYQTRPPRGLHSVGKLLALLTDTRLEWKSLAVTNALAYAGLVA
jgi:hypothetical protein